MSRIQDAIREMETQIGTSERLLESNQLKKNIPVDIASEGAGRGLHRCKVNLPNSVSRLDDGPF